MPHRQGYIFQLESAKLTSPIFHYSTVTVHVAEVKSHGVPTVLEEYGTTKPENEQLGSVTVVYRKVAPAKLEPGHTDEVCWPTLTST